MEVLRVLFPRQLWLVLDNESHFASIFSSFCSCFFSLGIKPMQEHTTTPSHYDIATNLLGEKITSYTTVGISNLEIGLLTTVGHKF